MPQTRRCRCETKSYGHAGTFTPEKFSKHADCRPGDVPVYEAAMIDAFDHHRVISAFNVPTKQLNPLNREEL